MENVLLNQEYAFHLENADTQARESGSRMMRELCKGSFKRHNLTNNAVSFTYKEPSYLSGFSCLLKSLNYSYVLECRGEEE